MKVPKYVPARLLASIVPPKLRRALFPALLFLAVVAAGGNSVWPIAQAQNTITTSFSVGLGAVVDGEFASAQFFSDPNVQQSLAAIGNQTGIKTTLGGVTVTATILLFDTIGPGSILIGDLGTCTSVPISYADVLQNCTAQNATPYDVPVGSNNLSIHTHTQTDIGVSVPGSSPLYALLAGDLHTNFQTALLMAGDGFLDRLLVRLRGDQIGGPQFGVNGLGNRQLAGRQTAGLGDTVFDGGVVQIAMLGTDGKSYATPWSVWLRPYGQFGRVSDSTERFGFNFGSAGFAAGLDYRFAGPWFIGAAVGYGHTWVNQHVTGDEGRIDSMNFGIYGGYNNERFYAVAALSYGHHWIKSDRLTILSSPASADYGGNSLNVGIEVGHKYDLGPVWIQPFVGAQYSVLWLNSFTESGSTFLEIAGKSQTTQSLKFSVGARIWQELEYFGVTFTPELRARVVHDVLNERRALTANFVGDPSQSTFTVQGTKPGPTAGIVGVGASMKLRANLQASMGYDVEFRSNLVGHTFQAALKYTW